MLDQSEQADYSAIVEDPDVQGFSYLSYSSNTTQDWDFAPGGFDQFFTAIQVAPPQSPVRAQGSGLGLPTDFHTPPDNFDYVEAEPNGFDQWGTLPRINIPEIP